MLKFERQRIGAVFLHRDYQLLLAVGVEPFAKQRIVRKGELEPRCLNVDTVSVLYFAQRHILGKYLGAEHLGMQERGRLADKKIIQPALISKIVSAATIVGRSLETVAKVKHGFMLTHSAGEMLINILPRR